MDLGISCPLKNSYLNPECLIIMSCLLGLAHCVTEGIDPVDMSVGLAEFLPLFGCEPCLLEFRILIDVIIKRNECIGIDKKIHLIRVDEVRVLTACNKCTCSFRSCLSGKPCLFNLYTPFISDHLSDLIVVIDL